MATLVLLFSVCCLGATLAGSTNPVSKWDRSLLQLQLHDVHISGGSMAETWRAISDQLGIRSVLVASEQLDAPRERSVFAFARDRCAVEELLRALITTVLSRGGPSASTMEQNGHSAVGSNTRVLGYDLIHHCLRSRK
jgi:hypothetical protein